MNRLDNLAVAIDAPRQQGRIKAIRQAFVEYTMALPWYVRWWRKLRGV